MTTLSPTLQRLQGETVKAYKIRLCENKDTYQINWNQIADLINQETGDNFGESKYRKWYVNYKEGYEDAMIKGTSNLSSAIEDQTYTLHKERIKNQTIGVHINRIAREDARKEMLIEEFTRAVKENSLQPPEFHSLPYSTGDKGAVLGFGDVHFGKIFESVNNKYDEEEVRLRLADLFVQTVNKINQEQLTHLHIVNGADNVDGIGLRISQLMSLQFGLMDQVIRYQRLMVEWLNRLSTHVKITYHHVPSSNHTEIRPLGTKAGQFPKEDVERLIATYIHDMLANNQRIEVPQYKDDYARFEICGYRFYAKHGHQIKNVKTALKDLSMLHREFIDYLILSHFHHAEEITVGEGETNDCEVIILPSVMGSDKFSDKLLTGAKAAGKMLIFEEGKGKVTSHTLKLN
ncbi:hypothetical protein BRE01_62270 [Brevibacillus reuszeri]|uniref:Uncharacterized protein n=1 Tax=Brevibacillus reuszeri TaxID=54915 RepID=A0A0K9YW21_9BACL|nr:hypothetical protein [Brevibacillus reuszeri]KNB72924.1 hypothetical protein ADS79_13945 [Brevibacillus reuszeri]GED72525.1 hypothetical protein BRE01_62270 [Brevibacillus reuszeri]